MASGLTTSWQIDGQIDGETMETVTDFIFLGSKITAGGDCSHEIKRRLLLGRKAMTTTQRDGMGREEGGGFRMGNTCIPVADYVKFKNKITFKIFKKKRKAMTNLDSILKSRDSTLPTKVCLVKAMVFPVVMYGYESWTVKKAEYQRTNAFELWCWTRLLRVPWIVRRSILN